MSQTLVLPDASPRSRAPQPGRHAGGGSPAPARPSRPPSAPHSAWPVGRSDRGRGRLALYALSYLAGGTMTTVTAVAELTRLRLSVDLLMILAAAGAAVLGDWGEGAVLLFLFSLSNTLEAYAMYRTTRSIDALIRLRPREACLVRDGVETRVEVEALSVGDTIRVRPGERFPVDGEVVEGETWADEATLTGESEPVSKAVGESRLRRHDQRPRQRPGPDDPGGRRHDAGADRPPGPRRPGREDRGAAARRVVARPVRRGRAGRLRVRLRRLLVLAPPGVRRFVLPRHGDAGRRLALRRGRRCPGGAPLGDRAGGTARGAVQGGRPPGDAGQGGRHRLRQDRDDHPGQAGRDLRLGGRRPRPGPPPGPGRRGRAAQRASPGRGGRRRGDATGLGPSRDLRVRGAHRPGGPRPRRRPLGRHRPRGPLRIARQDPTPRRRRRRPARPRGRPDGVDRRPGRRRPPGGRRDRRLRPAPPRRRRRAGGPEAVGGRPDPDPDGRPRAHRTGRGRAGRRGRCSGPASCPTRRWSNCSA